MSSALGERSQIVRDLPAILPRSPGNSGNAANSDEPIKHGSPRFGLSPIRASSKFGEALPCAGFGRSYPVMSANFVRVLKAGAPNHCMRGHALRRPRLSSVPAIGANPFRY